MNPLKQRNFLHPPPFLPPFLPPSYSWFLYRNQGLSLPWRRILGYPWGGASVPPRVGPKSVGTLLLYPLFYSKLLILLIFLGVKYGGNKGEFKGIEGGNTK